MRPITVVVDSGCDLPRQLCQQKGITVIPLYVNWMDKSYKDGLDLTQDTFYPRLEQEKVLPSTSQPTPGDFVNLFTELLGQGKDVLCLTISSGLSGTYHSAITARGMLADPDRVVVVDSLAASVGQGMLALEAVALVEKGLGLNQAAATLADKISRLRSVFTINTLEYLVKGGRLSALQGGLGTLLDIKPILHLDEHGKIVPLTKVRTRKRALAQLEAEIARQGKDLQGQRMGVCHSREPELAKQLADKRRVQYGASDVVVGEIGAVIGTHTGPGCVSVFFYGEKMR